MWHLYREKVIDHEGHGVHEEISDHVFRVHCMEATAKTRKSENDCLAESF